VWLISEFRNVAKFQIVYYVDPVLKANVYSSLISPTDSQRWAQPHYVCASGNCTFDAVASLGIIPFCKDISSMLNKTCTPLVVPPSNDTSATDTSSTDPSYLNCTVALPNGLSSWFVDGGLNSIPFIMSMQHDALSEKGLTTSIGTIQSILAVADSADISKSTKFIATECALPLVVESWKSSVGQVNQTSADVSPYQEELLDTWMDRMLDPLADDPTYTGDTLFLMVNPKVNPELGVYKGQRFGIPLAAYNSLVLFLGDIFEGYIAQVSDNLIFNPSASPTGSSMDVLQAIYFGNFTNCDTPEDKVQCAVWNMGRAMSKTFRDAPYVAGGVQKAKMTIGNTLVPVTYIKITWYWILLPIFIWILSVATLLGTAWKSRRARVSTWRTNPLAMVFLRLGVDEHDQVKHMGTSDAALSKKAEQLMVKLDVSREGAKLVG
jgi:hypothetical protein